MTKDSPCRICGGEQYEAEPHTTEEHSELWVTMADARDYGDVLWMPAHLIYETFELIFEKLPTRNKNEMMHVNRKIVQALVDTINEEGISHDAQDMADTLAIYLADNPLVPELEREY